MKLLAMAPTLALAACVLATTAATAATRSDGPVAPSSAARTPKRYTTVQSAAFTVSSGRQTQGAVACPVGTVVWGGGAVIGSPDLGINVNSSFPIFDGSGWGARVNASVGSSGSFVVLAICAKAPRKYRVLESQPFEVDADAQLEGTEPCPTGTVVLGGGSDSDSLSTGVNVNSTFPLASINGWRTDMNDDTAAPSGFRVLSICGKAPQGYAVLQGALVANAPESETQANVECASGKPLSGGALSSSGLPFVDLASTGPGTDGWSVSENNTALIADVTVRAFVICA
jgi:hypothetical protein